VKQKEQPSSIATVFTLWNALVGGSIITMPYCFYTSGIVVGSVVSFISYLI
jgi:amino acid permease